VTTHQPARVHGSESFGAVVPCASARLRSISSSRQVAIKLQAHCRAWLAKSRYQSFLRRLSKAQAIIRRYLVYQRFK
jgi:hypothetical protein